MLTFKDGPAEGQALNCRRAPVFLRVVQDKDGHWDALDQVNDHPTPDETIWVYYRVHGTLSGAFICSRSKKSESGFYQMAQYRVHPEQPEREVLEDYHQWGMWAEQEYQRILARNTMKREGRHQ